MQAARDRATVGLTAAGWPRGLLVTVETERAPDKARAPYEWTD